MAVMHLAWRPDARGVGLTPALTLAAGLAHAFAGVITGPRLLDGTRTRSVWHAGLIGAGTSALALVLFAPLFAAFLFATDIHAVNVFSYVALPLFIALFAFMAAGWALLLVSAGVGCALYRIAGGQVTL